MAALCGALAQSTDSTALVLAGAIFVASITAIAYFRSRSRDPGLTTELALFATYLVGVQCVISPWLGGACGAVLALLLAARRHLHHFARHWLSERELHDALTLAGLALVVLPLVPDQPMALMGGIHLRPLAALVLLILLVQAAGHVALRVFGDRLGLAASGFFSGFVSSTATIASLGALARRTPDRSVGAASGAAMSTSATWLQLLLIALALSRPAALVIAPVALCGLAATLLAGGWLVLSAQRTASSGGNNSSAGAQQAPQTPRALRLREALAVTALLTVVTVGVTAAQRAFGVNGLLGSAAVAGLADAHSPVASLTAIYAGGGLSERDLLLGVLLAVSANSVVRLFVALTAGGPRFASRVAPALVLGAAAAWVAWAVSLGVR